MTSDMNPTDLLTPSEAAALAGTTQAVVLRALREGRMVGIQSNSRQWTVTRRALVNYLRRTPRRRK